jgi:glycosyltransferase involved in cell wall biosynthesis
LADVLIWIVNPFDPLPGDPEQEGRYATLARLLAARGHRVTWWTSAFSHRFKRPVNQDAIRSACAPLNIEARFIPCRPYTRNVSLARLWNHAALVRNFRAAVVDCESPPEVVVASSPPPALAAAATQAGRQRGAKVLIDVQDCWPDAFTFLAPRPLRPALRPMVWLLRRHIRYVANNCDAVVGVADAYVNDFQKETRKLRLTASIPLGVDLATFDAAACAGRCREFTKPAGQVWLAHIGSLNRSYDCLTVLRAAARIDRPLREHVRVFMTSRGELADRAARLVRAHELVHVTLTGFLPFERWAYLLTQCDAGFNAIFPETMICLPNKVFYYLAAGVAVLNTVPGECSQIVRDGGCGFDYRAGDADDCAAAIEKIVRDNAERTAMKQASRGLAETVYDRALLFPKYVDLIERLGERTPQTPVT